MGSHHPRTVEVSTRPDDRSQARWDSSDEQRRIAAERAAAAYWRDVAEERRTTAAATQRRPLVRAAIAVDRRSGPLQSWAVGSVERLRRWAARIHLRILAARTVPSSGLRRRRLHSQVELADRLHGSRGRTMDVLVVDLDRAEAVGASEVDGRRGRTLNFDRGSRTRIDLDEVNRLVERCRPDAICVLADHAVPCSTTWIQQLGNALSSTVGVTVPTLVHPERPGRRTPHDLLTRSRGLVVETTDGAPVPRSVGAGDRVDVGAPEIDPVAATATCAVIDGDAWRDLGGLAVDVDADAAMIDLCIRIGASGRRIRNLPEVLVTDWRPVTGVADLTCEISGDSPAWTSAVAGHGPSLRRLGSPPPKRPAGTPRDAHGRCSITITTAVPSAKLTRRWGDWPYATAFAKALRRAGHPVLLQTLDQVEDPAGRANDVQLVIRGLAPVPRTAGQRHVLWVISHPEAILVEEYDRADLVLVASTRFADHVRSLTSTPVEVFLQATDPGHFQLRSADPPRPHQVLVVANSRGVLRRAVTDAEAAGLEYALVGSGWDGLVDPTRVLASHVDHADLPRLYASARLVLNDHWDTMSHWGFVSNRVLDVLACGTPVASDHLPELEQMFGDLVPTWRTPDELAAIVEDLRTDPTTVEKRALAARALVLDHHTFDRRAEELIDVLARHDLLPRSLAT